MKTGWMNDLLQMASNIFYDIAQSIEQLHYLLVAGNKFTFTKAFESSFFCLNSFIKKPLKNWKKLNLEKQDILFLQPYLPFWVLSRFVWLTISISLEIWVNTFKF